MLVLDKALGDQSRISTADVAKLRFSINRLKSSQDFQKFATVDQVKQLKILAVVVGLIPNLGFSGWFFCMALLDNDDNKLTTSRVCCDISAKNCII